MRSMITPLTTLAMKTHSRLWLDRAKCKAIRMGFRSVPNSTCFAFQANPDHRWFVWCEIVDYLLGLGRYA